MLIVEKVRVLFNQGALKMLLNHPVALHLNFMVMRKSDPITPMGVRKDQPPLRPRMGGGRAGRYLLSMTGESVNVMRFHNNYFIF